MKDVNSAVAYALLIPQLAKAGREVGYAIAVHGSLAKDLDIIAIPWTEEAVGAERLVLHLMACVYGTMRNGGRVGADGKMETAHGSEPTKKPHGRLAWTIHIGNESLYIDVSVMPRAAEQSSDERGQRTDYPIAEAAVRLDEREKIVARLRELASRGRDHMTWHDWSDQDRFLLGCATLVWEEAREQWEARDQRSDSAKATGLEPLCGNRGCDFVRNHPGECAPDCVVGWTPGHHAPYSETATSAPAAERGK